MEQTRMNTLETVENVQHAFVAFMPVGKKNKPGEFRQIESPVTHETAAEALFAEAARNIVKIADHNQKTAVCIDGRCAICTGADLVNGQLPEQEVDKTEVFAKLPGGMFHHATMMAIGAGSPIVAKAESYDEALAMMGAFLEKEGYVDSLHSTVSNYQSDGKTGCAARDQAKESCIESLDAPMADTLAVLWGAESAEGLCANSQFNAIRARLGDIVGMFKEFNSSKRRDELLENNPQHVELLEADNDHPTHLHVEEGVLINEIEGTTLDRDAMQGRLFCYDRWMAKKLAMLMGGTVAEQEQLLMASDYFAVAVANRITSPGMPVGLTQKDHTLAA